MIKHPDQLSIWQYLTRQLQWPNETIAQILMGAMTTGLGFIVGIVFCKVILKC